MTETIQVNLSIDTVEGTLNAIEVLRNSLNKDGVDFQEYKEKYDNLIFIWKEILDAMKE